MDQKHIVLITAVGIVALLFLMAAGNLTGAVSWNAHNLPDEQCHTLASNLHNAVSSSATIPYNSGQMTNPCTGEVMNFNSYIDKNMGGSYLVVWENGDARGYRMMTNYILCGDDRAEVTSRIGAYYNQGRGWGIYFLWQNNPHLEPPYREEKCSTF